MGIASMRVDMNMREEAYKNTHTRIEPEKEANQHIIGTHRERKLAVGDTKGNCTAWEMGIASMRVDKNMQYCMVSKSATSSLLKPLCRSESLAASHLWIGA